MLYAKRGNAGMCMEHFAGKWTVKAVSNKSTGNGCAYVAGGCAAEDCTSRHWRVLYDGKSYADAPLVKIVAEAVLLNILAKEALKLFR